MVDSLIDRFLKSELNNIVVAVLSVSLIFAFPNVYALPYYIIAIIIVFLFHELAHRYVARKFGCIAAFKLWPIGIAIGFMLMFMKFFNPSIIPFVAPGAVVIYPFAFGRWKFRMVKMTDLEMGIIAFSGIAVNLLFAILFKTILAPIDAFFIAATGFSLALVNVWLAFFNLLPVPPLDGSKIFRWKPWFWLLIFAGTIVLFIV